MKKVILFIILFFLSTTLSFALDQTMAFQGDALLNGAAINNGNLTVTIFDQVTGGNAVYNETFVNIINEGRFDVLLGNYTVANELSLDWGYNQFYFIDVEINGNKVTTERQRFQNGIQSGLFINSTGPAFSMRTSVADNRYSVAFGNNNNVSGDYGFIGSGASNKITSTYSVIGSGASNNVVSDYSVIGGGQSNSISDGTVTHTVIAGGQSNYVEGAYGVLVGGQSNNVSASYGFIGGGTNNIITTSGGQGYGIIVGGTYNDVSNDFGFIGSGQNNEATGTYAVVVGGGGSLIQPWLANIASGQHAVVVGGQGNLGAGDGSFIGSGYANNASGGYSTIVDGYENTVSTTYDFIGTGQNNFINQSFSSIVNGKENNNTGEFSFIAGGYLNNLNGDYSSILAGDNCQAIGNYNVILGGGNITIDNGIAGDSTDFNLIFGENYTSGIDNLVGFFDGIIRSGLFRFNTDNTTNTSRTLIVGIPGDVTTGNGAFLSASGLWNDGSSRTFKEDFQDIDKEEVLDKISSLEIKNYKYKGNNNARHISPFAEDIYFTFNIGETPKYLAALDVAGLSIVGIQQLAKENEDLKNKIGELEKRLEKLEQKQELQ